MRVMDRRRSFCRKRMMSGLPVTAARDVSFGVLAALGCIGLRWAALGAALAGYIEM